MPTTPTVLRPSEGHPRRHRLARVPHATAHSRDRSGDGSAGRAAYGARDLPRAGGHDPAEHPRRPNHGRPAERPPRGTEERPAVLLRDHAHPEGEERVRGAGDDRRGEDGAGHLEPGDGGGGGAEDGGEDGLDDLGQVGVVELARQERGGGHVGVEPAHGPEARALLVGPRDVPDQPGLDPEHDHRIQRPLRDAHRLGHQDHGAEGADVGQHLSDARDLDVTVGIDFWGDFGALSGGEDAFDRTGRWTRGPLRGYVYLLRNTGTTAKPRYAAADEAGIESGDVVVRSTGSAFARVIIGPSRESSS